MDRAAHQPFDAVVGRNLAGQSLRPDIPWTFGVLDDPTVNAFSGPGGYVVLTTGLLGIIENEGQLNARHRKSLSSSNRLI